MYKSTSLEKDYQHKFHVEQDLGIKVDLIDGTKIGEEDGTYTVRSRPVAFAGVVRTWC